MKMEKQDSNFQTPCASRIKRLEKGSVTPMVIPPSPYLKKLGYGTGVNVYLIERFSPKKGCYKSPWAVKKINSRLNVRPEFKTRLEEEAKILKSLHHPNIIGFRSQSETEDGNVCLVMESGQNSLHDIIESRIEKDLGPFPASSILKVAKSVASALSYLHKDQFLLHGDLKSSNILVKGEFEVIKLCDFGVTLKLNEKLVVEDPQEHYVGTECWSAPEVIKFEQISNKTDMFAFGLVLWEMLALNPPHQDKLEIDFLLMENLNDSELEKLEAQKEEEYQNALGTRPGLPDVTLDENYNKVLEIFFLCTNQNPSERPSAEQILKFFEEEK